VATVDELEAMVSDVFNDLSSKIAAVEARSTALEGRLATLPNLAPSPPAMRPSHFERLKALADVIGPWADVLGKVVGTVSV
jgi:hypothetical protein